MIDSKYLLNDEQMIQFITKGYLVLHNDLPQQIHQNILTRISYVLQEEGNPGNNILPRVPEIGQLFETPVVKGALSSVLGPGYSMHAHRHCHHNPAGWSLEQPWHKDGFWSSMRSHRPWWAMIFYYTQDVTEELGPTAIMPGTQYYEKFLADKGEKLIPTGKAGTMVLIHFDIWHKASLNTSNIDRYMLKFQFTRLKAPEYPSWNNRNKEMNLPDGLPVKHLNLWQDVWDWLRGERTVIGESGAVDIPRLNRLKVDLNSEDSAVRLSAADEAGLMGEASAECLTEVASLLNDPVEGVGLNAAYALGHMGLPGLNKLLVHLASGSNTAALRAAYGLQGAGKDAVPGLIEQLNHTDEKRRALAAFVLGMLGETAREAVPALIASLQDESVWARRNAVEALGMIAQPRGQIIPALSEALVDSIRDEYANAKANFFVNPIGYTAALSLLRSGIQDHGDVVLNALRLALKSEDRYVRAYAYEALTHLRSDESIDLLINYSRSARWCPDTHKASHF